MASTSPIGVIQKILDVEGSLGEFIANGPDNGLAGYVRDQYRKRCDQFANAPPWAQGLGNLAGGSLGRICEPWYADQGTDGPTSQAPFSGGQCPTLYDCQVTYRFAGGGCQNNGPFTDNYFSKQGPLSTTFIHDTSSSVPAGGLCPGYSKNRWELITANGNNNVIGVPRGVNIISFSVTRSDGNPDDCGDPDTSFEPGVNPPPDPGPTPGPEPTVDPRNPTGPPLLPVPPYDDPIGGPTPIVGPAPPAGGPAGVDDIPGSSDGAPGGPENVADPIAVNPGPGVGGEETLFGEPPSGRSWVGCFLQLVIPDEYGNIAGSGPANTVVPRVVANGSLVFAGGRGYAERIAGEWVTLFRPAAALEVLGVYVNFSPGITYTIYPVSQANCPDNSCSEET